MLSQPMVQLRGEAAQLGAEVVLLGAEAARLGVEAEAVVVVVRRRREWAATLQQSTAPDAPGSAMRLVSRHFGGRCAERPLLADQAAARGRQPSKGVGVVGAGHAA